MKKLLILAAAYFVSMAGAVEAKVFPLVVNSTFTNDTWFPLPIDQMKAAAVDTALTKISSTKKFAFLYESKESGKNTGSLNLAVTLVEPAESAKLTIKLSLPNNEGTFVSSSSVSLSNKNYKQIFEAFQKLGNTAADQLDISVSEITKDEISDKKNEQIYNEIVSLNIKVIKLHNVISNSGIDAHNKEVQAQLGKLDIIINKLDEHHEYVKNSDELQNKKLDSIYSELQKLNIGAYTSNAPPEGSELTPFDLKLLPIVNAAVKLKYKKDFNGAENILTKAVKTKGISELFRTAIEEELHINLPLYEADTRKTELSFTFTEQVKGDKYKITIDRITSLYESVLKRPDVLFEKRVEIKQKLDSLMISADSMVAVADFMRKNELHNLKMMLRVHMQRRMMMQSMANSGFCPDDDELNKLMRKASVSVFKIKSIKEEGEWCELALIDSNNKLEHIKFNYEEVIISEEEIVSEARSQKTVPLQPVKKNQGKRPRNYMVEQGLRNKAILFSNATSSYYKKNNTLPKSIDDLQCTDTFNNWIQVPCASSQKDDVFYINYEDDWVSVKSYISEGKILKKCKATRQLEMLDERYGECGDLNVNSIPKS